MSVNIGDDAPVVTVDAYVRDEATPVETRVGGATESWTVLFFYPRDFTFLCPAELRGFAELEPAFALEGASVMAASTDSWHVHRAWLETSSGLTGIRYPVLADPMVRTAACEHSLSACVSRNRGLWLSTGGGAPSLGRHPVHGGARIGPVDRLHADRLRGLRELHRARQRVVIGEGERLVPTLCGSHRELLGQRGPVEERVGGVRVQFGVAHANTCSQMGWLVVALRSGAAACVAASEQLIEGGREGVGGSAPADRQHSSPPHLCSPALAGG